MSNSDNKNNNVKSSNSGKPHPNNAINTLITLSIIIIISPLAYLDSLQWEPIISDAVQWHRIKKSKNKIIIRKYSKNKTHNKHLILRAKKYLEEITNKDRDASIARIKVEMDHRIKYLNLLNIKYNNDVQQIQEILTLHGYYHGKLDGLAGKTTLNAIKNYKKDHNIKPASSVWNKNIQISTGLLNIYKGYEVTKQLLNPHNNKIMQGYKIIIQQRNNPVQTISKIKNRIKKMSGYPCVIVLGVFIEPKPKLSSLIIFRHKGMLKAYNNRGKLVSLPQHVKNKIYSVERLRTKNNKLAPLETIVVFSETDYKSSNDPFKIINRLVYYYSKYSKHHGLIVGKSELAVLAINHPAALFRRGLTGFNQKDFITSIVNPAKVKTTVFHPVISRHNGWIKLASIKIDRNSESNSSMKNIFSIDIVNRNAKILAKYPNLTYVRAGPVKKGQFFALSINNNTKSIPVLHN